MTYPSQPESNWGRTRPAPPLAHREQVEQWLDLASRAPDPHTALDYAQRAIDLRPNDPRVQATVQRSVLQRLSQDPFVAYLAETDRQYVVVFRNSRPVAVPKARAQPEVFPPSRSTPIEAVWRLIGLMLIGLLPAGLGALLLSPLVVPRAAAILLDEQADLRDQRSAWLALVVGSLVSLAGAVLALTLLLHIIV